MLHPFHSFFPRTHFISSLIIITQLLLGCIIISVSVVGVCSALARVPWYLVFYFGSGSFVWFVGYVSFTVTTSSMFHLLFFSSIAKAKKTERCQWKQFRGNDLVASEQLNILMDDNWKE
jgi:hypothetical protein